jgi:hypothetical protein
MSELTFRERSRPESNMHWLKGKCINVNLSGATIPAGKDTRLSAKYSSARIVLRAAAIANP